MHHHLSITHYYKTFNAIPMSLPIRLITLLSLLIFIDTNAQTLHPIQTNDSIKTGTDSLRPNNKERNLSEATVTATRLVFVTKKDTVIYDMDALGATKGDMLQDMIGRMPGLEMKNGALYYRGKVVNRLLVNGTDFKRGDTKKALENLPAYIIKNVKAYEDLTDEAKVTGLDDGTRQRVVNVILKKKYLGAWTGNADVGQGTDHRWLYRAFANTFTERSRVSMYGGFTNTAQYQSVSGNGDWEDNGGAGSSSGDTRYMQPGVSFMWNNGREQNKPGYVMIDGSAGWDYRGHNDRRFENNETFLDDGTTRTDMSNMHTKNDERIWNADFSLAWQPTARTHIDLRPQYSYTDYTDRQSVQRGQWNKAFTNAEGFVSPLDSLLKYSKTGWPIGEGRANMLTRQEGDSKQGTHAVANWLYVTHKLTDNNWRLSLRNSLYYNYRNNKDHSLDGYQQYQTNQLAVDPLYNRYTQTDDHNFSLQNFIDLNVPLPIFQTMRFTYGTTLSRNHSNANAYRLERLGGEFADFDTYLRVLGLLPATDNWQQLARDGEQTINSLQLNRRHWFENQLQYNNKHGLTIYLQNTYRLVYDRLDYVKGQYAPLHPHRHATEYYLGLNARWQTDSIGTFTFSYSYNTDNPTLLQTITLPDNSNPLSISYGNPDLHKRHSNQLNMGYECNFKHGQIVSLGVMVQRTTNMVTSRQTYNKLTGVTISEQVNLRRGQWSISPNLSFSTPLDKKQRINLTISNYYNWNDQPLYAIATTGTSILYNRRLHNFYSMQNLNFRLGKFNAEMGHTLMFASDKMSNPASKRITSYATTLQANMQYTLPWSMDVKSSVYSTYQRNGSSLIESPWHTVWNLSITQSFMRSKSLALKVEASDLLNQREQTWSYVDTNSRFSGWSQSVGRFFMLHLIYRFSTKK